MEPRNCSSAALKSVARSWQVDYAFQGLSEPAQSAMHSGPLDFASPAAPSKQHARSENRP